MLPAGPLDGHLPTQPSSGAPGPTHSASYIHRRGDVILVPVDPPVNARSTSTRIWSSAAKAFLRRTIARLLRPHKQTAQHGLTSPPRRDLTLARDQVNVPLSDTPPLIARGGFASLTPLVLQRVDDIAFSPSSFFRRVEEVRALGSSSDNHLALSPPLPLQLRPRRRPPPPVDEDPAQAMPPKHSSLSRRAQMTPRKPSTKPEFDSVLELQTLAMELDNLDPLLVNSPPRTPHCLHASPSIKFVKARPPLWSTSSSAALKLGCDPLAELLAVADELKTMKNLDSDDILYMTDVLPPPPLPQTLHAFLDAPGASLRILEMDVHNDDETFLGVPIPCIVVTSEGDSLPTAVSDVHVPPSPSEELLAPPPTTYRGRIETDRPPIVTGDSERSSSPPPPPPPCENMTDKETDMVCALSSPSECSSADANLSWEVVSTVGPLTPSNQCTKPVRPTTPKPAPLLRRRERSLLRRMLGGDDEPPADRNKPRRIYPKRKRNRISKDTIGSPRLLLPAP